MEVDIGTFTYTLLEDKALRKDGRLEHSTLLTLVGFAVHLTSCPKMAWALLYACHGVSNLVQIDDCPGFRRAFVTHAAKHFPLDFHQACERRRRLVNSPSLPDHLPAMIHQELDRLYVNNDRVTVGDASAD
jgi:hypothetical protein